MAFDGVMLNRIVSRLEPLVNGRISRIYQISDTEVLFLIKAGRLTQLMVSAHSSYNRIHITDRSYPTRSTPSNFIMLMRKYLEGAYITAIRQVEMDRYLIMEVSSRNELGDRILLKVCIELMGKYANIILVNEDNRIIDALKHIPPYENTLRTIWPGAEFRPTPAQTGRQNPFEIDAVDSSENLSRKLQGVSPLLADEIEFRMNNGQSYRSIMDQLKNSSSLYITGSADRCQFHAIPLTHLSEEYEEYEICEGLDHIYYVREERERIRNISGDLFKFTRRQISHYQQRIERLNDQLLEAEGADRYRLYGETLYANYGTVTKGLDSITLPDYDGNEVIIPLDPKLDLKGNAARHFTRYRKLTTGTRYMKEQLAKAEESLSYFRQLEIQLQQADFASAAEIREELVSNGYLKAKAVKGRARKPKEPNYVRIEFNGHIIMAGRNNIQNDYLTFHKAGRYDTWLHVKDMSSAHVIINSDTPDEATLRLAAMLAVWYSPARESSSVPVNYTLVRDLKKIPASKLGLVSLKHYRTIYIDADPQYLSDFITI